MLTVTEKETSTVISLAQTYKPGWACEGGGQSGRGAGRGGAQPGRTNRCHRCGRGDHFFSNCTHPADEWREVERTEVADGEVSCNFNHGYDRVVTLAQHGHISLSPNLIFLDTCSMCLVCNDSSLLHNGPHFKEHGLSQGLRIVSNGDTMDCDQVGSIGALSFHVWYNDDSIANILLVQRLLKTSS